MARTPKAMAATAAAAGQAGPAVIADLAGIEATMTQEATAAATAAQARLEQLQATRANLVTQLETVDRLIVLAGGAPVAAPRRRSRKPGRKAGSGGGKGSRGKRDPLGLKGHIAKILIKHDKPMDASVLTSALKKVWKNPSATFNTQVYQIANKMAAAGDIAKPGRGTYAANAATKKFLTALEAEIAAK